VAARPAVDVDAGAGPDSASSAAPAIAIFQPSIWAEREWYGDDAGDVSGDGVFVWGVVTADDPGGLRRFVKESLDKWRLPTTHELKYSSTDRLDLPVALEVIERCFAVRGFVFRALIRLGSGAGSPLYRSTGTGARSANDAKRVGWTSAISAASETWPGTTAVTLDWENTDERDLRASYLQQMTGASSVIVVDSKAEPLVQVADLLVGATRNAVVDKAKNERKVAITRAVAAAAGFEIPLRRSVTSPDGSVRILVRSTSEIVASTNSPHSPQRSRRRTR
jgi:hypothetical protein